MKKGPSGIVTGQKVTDEKIALARSMRKEMSPIERILWTRLRDNQLEGFRFRRQQIIAGYIADFYCHRAGLVVEIDGDTHDAGDDEVRDRVFSERGIRVLRFTNTDVFHHCDSVVEVILEHLTSP